MLNVHWYVILVNPPLDVGSRSTNVCHSHRDIGVIERQTLRNFEL